MRCSAARRCPGSRTRRSSTWSSPTRSRSASSVPRAARCASRASAGCSARRSSASITAIRSAACSCRTRQQPGNSQGPERENVMEVGKLTVTLRGRSGKGGSRKLRAQGMVPGVCYGASIEGPIEPLPIILDVKQLRGALDPVRKRNTVLSLTIEGGAAPRTLHALVKDFQIDALRREVTHVDLLAIDPDKEVRADVPIAFLGT